MATDWFHEHRRLKRLALTSVTGGSCCWFRHRWAGGAGPPVRELVSREMTVSRSFLWKAKELQGPRRHLDPELRRYDASDRSPVIDHRRLLGGA